MQQSAIFLLPTLIDTGPTALKEALAMGLWPVCYDNSGPAEYVRMAQFGTLARDRDRGDLTKRLKGTLEEKPWLDLKRRAVLREFTRRRFSREVIWTELIRLYKDVSEAAA
jgi:glycosyltransferase involved in cell wall biosynthesis